MQIFHLAISQHAIVTIVATVMSSIFQRMRYQPGQQPENVTKLQIRRKNLIRRLKSQSQPGCLDAKALQQLNDAYEFLKADLEETYDLYRHIRDDTDIQVMIAEINVSL